MELWIRSQDKEIMLCVHALAIAKDEIGSILGFGIDRNMKVTLGTYKTKKRALEILDEIQKYIADSFTKEEINQFFGGGKSKAVYEMPKE